MAHTNPLLMKLIQPSPLTLQKAERLTKRFFEAQTTEAEEEWLKRFAVSPAGASPRFDELRAVLGLAAYASRQTTPRRSRTLRLQRQPLRYAAAVACCLIMGGAAIFTYSYRQQNQCLAYINGVRTTDSERVMAAMHQSVAEMAAPTGTCGFEQQLGDMLRTPLEE